MSEKLLAALPLDVNTWSKEHVNAWLRITGLEHMQGKLQGMDGENLMELSRGDVVQLTRDSPMDCFVFSAHLGDVRRRHTGGELDLVLETPGTTPRLHHNVQPPTAMDSLNGTPRFLEAAGRLQSNPGNPLGLPDEYIPKTPREVISGEKDTKGGDSVTHSVEIIVKPKAGGLHEMLTDVLKEAKEMGNKEHFKQALLKADPHRRLSRDESIDQAIDSLLMRSSSEIDEDVCEALMAALWQPLMHGHSQRRDGASSSRAASAILGGEASDQSTITTKSTADTSTTTDASEDDGDDSPLEGPLEEPVPIRSKFQASQGSSAPVSPVKDDQVLVAAAAHEVLVDQSTLELSEVMPPDASIADMSIASSINAAAICVESRYSLGDLDDSRRQMLESAVLYQVRNSPRSSPRFTSQSNPNSNRYMPSLLAPVIMEEEGEGEMSDEATPTRMEPSAEEQQQPRQEGGEESSFREAREASKAAQAAAERATEAALQAVEDMSDEGSPISTPKPEISEEEPPQAACGHRRRSWDRVPEGPARSNREALAEAGDGGEEAAPGFEEGEEDLCTAAAVHEAVSFTWRVTEDDLPKEEVEEEDVTLEGEGKTGDSETPAGLSSGCSTHISPEPLPALPPGDETLVTAAQEPGKAPAQEAADLGKFAAQAQSEMGGGGFSSATPPSTEGNSGDGASQSGVPGNGPPPSGGGDSKKPGEGREEDHPEKRGGGEQQRGFSRAHNVDRTGIFGVPPLPAHYVHRPEIFDETKAKVLSGSSVAILGIDNLLGIGSSTLAAAVAADKDVRAEFSSGGVFWLSYESGHDERIKLQELLELMQQAGLHVPPLSGRLPGLEIFQAALSGDAKALLILDDCPHHSFAKTFLEFGFTLLLTSRDQSVPRHLGIDTCVVPAIDKPQAARFLELASEGSTEDAVSRAALLCAGLPMELAIIAALGRNKPKSVWRKVASRLEAGNPLKEFAGELCTHFLFFDGHCCFTCIC